MSQFFAGYSEFYWNTWLSLLSFVNGLSLLEVNQAIISLVVIVHTLYEAKHQPAKANRC